MRKTKCLAPRRHLPMPSAMGSGAFRIDWSLFHCCFFALLHHHHNQGDRKQNQATDHCNDDPEILTGKPTCGEVLEQDPNVSPNQGQTIGDAFEENGGDPPDQETSQQDQDRPSRFTQPGTRPLESTSKVVTLASVATVIQPK